MPLPINSTKAKKTTCISLWSFCLSFLFQALCFVIVFYVLDIFWIKLTFLSLGLVTLRALLIACLSFSVCVWCLFFSMCFLCVRFSGRYWHLSPWAWLLYQLFWSLVWVLCLVFFSPYLFNVLDFLGYIGIFPPQAWLPCRPFWSLVWETSGRLLLTNKSLFTRKDWTSSTKYIL